MFTVECVQRDEHSVRFLHVPAECESSIIIFLHGFPDGPFAWNHQMEALKGAYQIVAPFLERTTIEELKKDIIQIIKHVRRSDEQKIYIVAHDLGSFLSVDLYHDLSLKIHGLVHINGMGLDQFTSRKFSATQWLKSYYVLLAQFGPVRTLVTKLFPEFFLQLIYNLGKVNSKDELRRINEKSVLSNIKIYQNLFRKSFYHLGKNVRKVQVPALFIWGKDDVFLNTPDLYEVYKFYDQPTMRILKGGHWVQRSNCAHVNKLLIKTLACWEKVS